VYRSQSRTQHSLAALAHGDEPDHRLIVGEQDSYVKVLFGTAKESLALDPANESRLTKESRLNAVGSEN
jgi:hypothetical protein